MNNEKGRFEDYVVRFCINYGLTEEEALEYAMIREAKKYYEEES